MKARLRLGVRAALGAILVLPSLGSCYEPELEDCTIRCGAGSSCPSGQHCDNGFCAASNRSCSADSGALGAGGGGTWNSGGTEGAEAGVSGGGSAGTAGSGPPLSIPVSTDLVFWFDATQGLGPGPGVDIWEDASDRGNDAAQDESALQPQLTSFDDLPAVSFDGVADYLTLRPEFPDFSRGLAFIVVLHAQPFPSESALFHMSSNIGFDGIDLHLHPEGIVHFQSFSQGLEWNGPLPTEQVSIVGVNVSPATGGKLYFNGQSVTEDPTLSVPIDGSPGGTLENVLGAGRGDTYAPYKGLLFEFVFYNRALDADELPAMTAYLRDKWRCCE